MKKIVFKIFISIFLLYSVSVQAKTICDCYGSCVYIHPRDVNYRLKQYIKERDGYNKFTRLDIDHIIPLCLGGSNDAGNLQALTKKEHEAKTQNDLLLLNYVGRCLMTVQEAQNEARKWKKAK